MAAPAQEFANWRAAQGSRPAGIAVRVHFCHRQYEQITAWRTWKPVLPGELGARCSVSTSDRWGTGAARGRKPEVDFRRTHDGRGTGQARPCSAGSADRHRKPASPLPSRHSNGCKVDARSEFQRVVRAGHAAMDHPQNGTSSAARTLQRVIPPPSAARTHAGRRHTCAAAPVRDFEHARIGTEPDEAPRGPSRAAGSCRHAAADDHARCSRRGRGLVVLSRGLRRERLTYDHHRRRRDRRPLPTALALAQRGFRVSRP